eukprot:1512037-Amphidinium_carterae.1
MASPGSRGMMRKSMSAMSGEDDHGLFALDENGQKERVTRPATGPRSSPSHAGTPSRTPHRGAPATPTKGALPRYLATTSEPEKLRTRRFSENNPL